jgi:hypothetical protein
MHYREIITCILAASFVAIGTAHAQGSDASAETASPASGAGSELVSYDADYFNRFKPLTALDMVRQVPGFQLEESEDGQRGFANGAGNLLINDQRPSAKQDLSSAILSRIPAGNVERIELIRGQVRGIDLRGQSSLINIILRADNPATVKWEGAVLVPFKHGPLTPIVNVSLSDKWKELEYNTGLSMTKNSYGRHGLDQLFNGSGVLTENRYDNRENRITTWKGNFNGVTLLSGGTLVKLNTVLSHETRDQFLVSDRVPVAAGSSARVETFDDNSKTPGIEIGLDAERNLYSDLTGKAILLFFRKDEQTYRTQRVLDTQGNQTSFRVAEGDGLATELITRLEFDWRGLPEQTLQLNLERAYNSLDRTLVSTLDTGSGPVAFDVPGADSLVKEERYDMLLQDTWARGKLQVDLGLGAEASTITQSGDAEQQRDFFFIKPQGVLTYTQEQGRQTRFRLAREVAQLDLTDFVSATLFEDDDLALGNPDIQPDTTWISELSHERRFGDVTVVKLTAYHHWIANVLDLLPLSPTFEVPGNIGDGRRWGVELEATLPLEWLGLTGAKVDVKTRWQDSTVVDPVTGQDRILSSIEGDFPIIYDVPNRHGYSIDYRQDFEVSRVAWGWTLISRGERPLFKVNELEVWDETPDLGMFVETTRWLGIKVRLSAINVLDTPGSRVRTVFTGERDLSPVRFREIRERDRDQSVTLTFSGVF